MPLNGTLHDLFHVTLDGRGGFHLHALDNPQGVSGLGEMTGTTYRATGATKVSINGNVGFELTYVDNFHIIGQGGGSKFWVKVLTHVTINANGTSTAAVDHESFTC